MDGWGTNSGVAIAVVTHTLLSTILLVDAFLTYRCLFSGWFDCDIHVEAFTVIPSGCPLMILLTGQCWVCSGLISYYCLPGKEPRWFDQVAKSPNTLKVSKAVKRRIRVS